MLLLMFYIAAAFVYSTEAATVSINVTVGGKLSIVTGNDLGFGYSFLGMPYAYPPIKNLRFTAAQLMDLPGSVDGREYGSECYQSDKGAEDCLFINVFTPKGISATSKLPVFVWAFGGGFVSGNGNMQDGIYPNLVNRGPMILVTFNYRVGPFGFFTTRNSIAPGNAGISDCIAALQWVQKYITSFGGDPTRVTFGGQSSGAEAVSAVSMSPAANGLYQQLIFQSASMFSAAVMSYSDSTRNTSFALAQLLGCVSSQSEWTVPNFPWIVDCVRQKSVRDINAANDMLPSHRMPWAPVQDTSILPDRLENLALKRKSVPVLAGVVHDEWLLWVRRDIRGVDNNSNYTKEGLRSTLKNSYEMTFWDHQDAVETPAEAKYIDGPNISPDDHVGWLAQDIALFSELIFIGPVLRDARYFAYTGSNVFLYSFDYLSPNALPTIKDQRLRGVQHGWELQYIFYDNCLGFKCTDDDRKLRKLTSAAWTNFVVYGNPTPPNSGLDFEWATLDSTNRYLSITPEPTMKTRFHENSTFWACTDPDIDGYAPPFSC